MFPLLSGGATISARLLVDAHVTASPRMAALAMLLPLSLSPRSISLTPVITFPLTMDASGILPKLLTGVCPGNDDGRTFARGGTYPPGNVCVEDSKDSIFVDFLSLHRR